MSKKSETNSTKNLIIGVLIVILGIHFITSIANNSSSDSDNVVYVEKNYASDGLDLQSVLELSKSVDGPKELEEKLNSPDGINNLDLDEDGYIDYIYVTEYGDDNHKGFSLTIGVDNDEQEIATLEFVNSDNEVDIEAKGNEQIYGHNHYYHSRVTLGDILLFNYLFSPHRYWVSPYYGYYRYPTYRTVSYTTYRTRTSSYTKNSAARSRTSSSLKSSYRSPNNAKVSNSIKAKLRNPTTSQKSFQAKTSSKKRSGGFGKKTSSSVRRTSYSSGGSGGK